MGKTYKIELEEFDVFVLMTTLLQYADSEYSMYMDWKNSADPAKQLAIADVSDRLEDIVKVAKKIDPENPIVEALETFCNEVMEDKQTGIDVAVLN